MDIKKVKLELMQQLLDTENEDLLEKVRKLIETEVNQPTLTKEHRKILDQRLADHKANPSAGSTWPEVKKRIKSKL